MAGKSKAIEEPIFLRDWSKHPSNLDDDMLFVQLPFEVQGVFFGLLRYTQRKSKTPGFFLDASGTPVHEKMIAYDVARHPDRIPPVQDAMKALKRAGYLTYGAADGWEIVEYEDRYATPPERVKIRVANKQRQAALRSRRRSTTVVDLDARRAEGAQ